MSEAGATKNGYEVRPRNGRGDARDHNTKRHASKSEERKSKKPATRSIHDIRSTTGSLKLPGSSTTTKSTKTPTDSSSDSDGYSTESSSRSSKSSTAPTSTRRRFPSTGALRLPGSPTTNVPIPEPISPILAIEGSSSSTSGSVSNPKRDPLDRRDAQGRYLCKEKGCETRSFGRGPELNRHIKTRHKESENMYPCPLGKLCTDVIFHRQDVLDNHLRSKAHKDNKTKWSNILHDN